MADLRIDHAFVVTMDPARRVLADASVVVAKDRIVAIGPTPDIAPDHPAARVIDARGMAMLPGFIDAHAHAGHTLVKSMGGVDNDAWYEACAQAYMLGSDAEFWRADAALGALERLKCGITCGVSLLGGGNALMRSDVPDHAAAHLDAIAASGLRVMLAVGPTLPPHPRTYRRWEGDLWTDTAIGFDRQMRTCAEIIDTFHGTLSGRLNIAMLYPTIRPEHVESASAAELAVMEEQTLRARRLSRERAVLFTQDGHTRGTVARAAGLGTLGPDILLSHATDLTEEEIRMCADTDTKIAHNPSAIGSILGRCPVPELLAVGVTVALGSDAAAPDRGSDMFRHMVQCMHYHRRHFRDPAILPPGRVLEMATIGAARALGLEAEIGSLEPGKKADLILVDLARPHLYPPNMPLFRLVYYANGADVDTVVVDGRVLMRGHEVGCVDERAVLAAAAEATETMLRRTGLSAMLDERGFFGA